MTVTAEHFELHIENCLSVTLGRNKISSTYGTKFPQLSTADKQKRVENYPVFAQITEREPW